jgi:hypothetical protein
MKNLLLISALLFSSLSLFAQSSKTYVKVVPVGALSAVAAIPTNIQVKACKGSRVTIQYTVTANVSPRIIDALTKAGRYTFDMNTLTFPNTKKAIFINGVQLEEDIEVVILYPSSK